MESENPNHPCVTATSSTEHPLDRRQRNKAIPTATVSITMHAILATTGLGYFRQCFRGKWMLDWIIVSGRVTVIGARGGCSSPGGYCAHTVENLCPHTHPSITSTNKRLSAKTLCWKLHSTGSTFFYLLSCTVQDRHSSICWKLHGTGSTFFYLLSCRV